MTRLASESAPNSPNFTSVPADRLLALDARFNGRGSLMESGFEPGALSLKPKSYHWPLRHYKILEEEIYGVDHPRSFST
ncbi:hypothetical protein AVEN_107742-1 [Araneus ventricosus]|uniref:Uncharacterized protein n=1 Tax=Araneus ventricosus TaxID=182803 RepID=A0A4Y2IXZ0_ARAVE|nr:hypothetical protein AVEN_107742-1 [Araneus ventricosus]